VTLLETLVGRFSPEFGFAAQASRFSRPAVDGLLRVRRGRDTCDVSDTVDSKVRWPGRLLLNLPGLVALGLALLYAIGALAKVSDVAGAGYSAPIVLQQTPIQQLLALGVSNVASPESVTGITVSLLWIAGMAWWWERSLTKDRDKTNITRWKLHARIAWAYSVMHSEGRSDMFVQPSLWGRAKKAGTWFMYYGGGVVGVLLVLLILLRLSPPGFVSAVVLFPATLWIGLRLRWRLRLRVGIALAVFVVGDLAGHGLFYPSPLPQVTLVTTQGTIKAELLVNTDSAVTVGLPNCQIETVPSSQIRSITLVAAENEPIRTLGAIIFGEHYAVEREYHSGRCSTEAGVITKPRRGR
jgi:hypothetical protein